MGKSFVLFKHGPSIGAMLVPERDGAAQAIQLSGVSYRLLEVYLGDFNHLLDNSGQLVGFELPYWEITYPELRKWPLISETKGALIESNGDLRLWPGDSRSAQSDLSHALGGELFVGKGDVVLSLPEITDWTVSSGNGFELLKPEDFGFMFH